jgi:hypothetical protein
MAQAQQGTQLSELEENMMDSIWNVINAEEQIPDREESGKIGNSVALTETIAKLYTEYVRQITAEAIEKGEPAKIYGPQDFIVMASEAAKDRLWTIRREYAASHYWKLR